ncbi:porin family protein [Myroides sp. DW712]|uniref:porin family protein n=1 Tax=Myroides sp. DW712 TaxID=3389800 RepID=UPI00397A3F60
MKKITMSLLAIFAFSAVTVAQTPDIKLGAKAGLNMSNLSGADNTKSKTGFHVGALAEIFINEKFSVQPEVLYSSQGAKGKGSDSAKFNLDYINVPIMAKYYVMDGLSVQAGPQIGFNVKAEAGDVDVKDLINTVDFGLNFGAGYELPMGVFFDARYDLGLTKVYKEGKSIKNGVFQLSVGYKF